MIAVRPTGAFDSREQRPVKQSFLKSLRRDTHWKCLILTFLISICLWVIGWCQISVDVIANFHERLPTFSGSINERSGWIDKSRKNWRISENCHDGYIYIPLAFAIMLYVVYLVECWHCHTRIELQHKTDVNSIYDHIHLMQETFPVIWWKAMCYHYVRRSRQVTRYRNGDAFITTQVYYERVNTHISEYAFNFIGCGLQDVSNNLSDLEIYPATKIKFSKGFSFANWEAESDFERQRVTFFRDNERRDDYMETNEGMDLLNVTFKENLITFADSRHQPWYVSHAIFWILSFLLLSWPLRVLIEYKTAYVHYHVHKEFGQNYDNSLLDRSLTRGESLYQNLESAISNNYALVPSYSEALLINVQQSDHLRVSINSFYPQDYVQNRSVSYNEFCDISKDKKFKGLSNPSFEAEPFDSIPHSCTDTKLYLDDSQIFPSNSNSIINKSESKKPKFLSVPNFRYIFNQSNENENPLIGAHRYYDNTLVRVNRYRRNNITGDYEIIPEPTPNFFQRVRQFFSSLSLQSSSESESPPTYEDALLMQRIHPNSPASVSSNTENTVRPNPESLLLSPAETVL